MRGENITNEIMKNQGSRGPFSLLGEDTCKALIGPQELTVADDICMMCQYEGHVSVIFNIIGWTNGEILVTRVITMDMPCGVDDKSMASSCRSKYQRSEFYNSSIIEFWKSSDIRELRCCWHLVIEAWLSKGVEQGLAPKRYGDATWEAYWRLGFRNSSVIEFGEILDTRSFDVFVDWSWSPNNQGKR